MAFLKGTVVVLVDIFVVVDIVVLDVVNVVVVVVNIIVVAHFVVADHMEFSCVHLLLLNATIQFVGYAKSFLCSTTLQLRLSLFCVVFSLVF